MAKRMTDTDIWKTQRWFRKLNPMDKLVFCYIKDQCNHAGIWRIDCSDLLEDLGIEEFDIKKFISSVNTEYDKMNGRKTQKDRLIIVKTNFLWITGFVQFQYENKEGKVSPDAAPVKTAFQILQGYGILKQAFDKGYITLIQGLLNPPARAKDKDKDIDKVSINTKKKVATPKKKKIEEVTFNTMPKAIEFNGLPDQYINISIELIYNLNNKLTIPKETIIALWEAFKVQHLTGQNYYPNAGKVYSHFVNIIKKEKFNNGNGINKTAGVEGSIKSLLSKPKW